MAKYNLETKDGIEALKNIKDQKTRERMVKRNPEVVVYACKYWSEDKVNFSKLVDIALKIKPEVITMFKDKNGLYINNKNLQNAILADPMVIAKLSDELKDQVTADMFIDAFIRNPLVLSIKDLPCLKHRFSRVVEVMDKGQTVIKKLSTTVRTECLKAIRLSEGVSNYHKGYDDIALVIANGLNNSKSFQSKKYSAELLKEFATLMNAMIKKENQKLRAVSPEAWLTNNGKPMYKAVRKSAKKNSQLEGLLADLPTARLPEKVVKRLVIAAVKTNPEIYLHLTEYGLSRYVDDATVKYNVFKSLKKHGMLKQKDRFLSEEDSQKASNKLAGAEKRKKAKQQATTENKENEN